MQLNMNLRCPHCGQGIPPKLRVTGYIRPQVVHLIAQRPDGISLREVANMVYRTDPNQPGSSKSVWLLIRLANRELKPQGYQIAPLTRGPGARWILRKLEDADPKRKPARDQNTAGLERAQSAGAQGEH
jgi:hypothetical protein